MSYVELGGASPDANAVPYTIPGLVFWLDPNRYDDPAAPWLLNGTKVALAPSVHDKWNPAGDSTRSVSQPTDSKRPVLIVSDPTFNGKNTLSFVKASTQYLQSVTWATSVPHPISTYAVFTTTDVSAVATSVIDSNASPTSHQIFCALTTGNVTANSNGAQINSPSSALNTPRVVCAVHNGASSTVYVSSAASGTAGTLNAQNVANMRIGASFALSGFFEGKIATILVYSGAHDRATRARIMSYLGNLYGIAVTT